MSRYWEGLAERSEGLHKPEDFAAAAYRLVCEQVLYYADRASKVAYSLIERYERDFAVALDAIGVDVRVNRQLRYVCAIPVHAKIGSATQEQTALVLTLRKLYDEGAHQGEMNDDGEILCDLVELAERHRLETQRELPEKGRLDALLRTIKRWGVARIAEDEGDDTATASSIEQPYVIAIRPGIADVLGETALLKLALWTPATQSPIAPTDVSAAAPPATSNDDTTASGGEGLQ
jgi:hypothetical protein